VRLMWGAIRSRVSTKSFVVRVSMTLTLPDYTERGNQSSRSGPCEDAPDRFRSVTTVLVAYVQVRHHANARRRPLGDPDIIFASAGGHRRRAEARRQVYHADVRLWSHQ